MQVRFRLWGLMWYAFPCACVTSPVLHSVRLFGLLVVFLGEWGRVALVSYSSLYTWCSPLLLQCSWILLAIHSMLSYNFSRITSAVLSKSFTTDSWSSTNVDSASQMVWYIQGKTGTPCHEPFVSFLCAWPGWEHPFFLSLLCTTLSSLV